MQLDNKTFFADVEKVLDEGHDVTIRAKGRSMYPFIIDGVDHIVLRRARTAGQGDIVLARIDGRGYILHRVYKAGSRDVTLMGDGNLHATEHCRQEDIIGKACAIIRKGRIIDCTSAPERAKARIWRGMLPVRRYLLFIIRHFHKIRPDGNN